jgi:hypothetical protein
MQKWLAGGAAAAALGVAGHSAWSAGARVCFEAESATSVQSPLKKVAAKGVGGSGYLAIPWDKNKTKGIGQATYKVNAPASGTYYLWARVYWQNGCGNSVLVSVNDTERVLGEDGLYDRWHWVGGSARVPLKAGANTIVLKNRETGVRVDQFYLTQDGGYTPTGIRKATQ